MGRFCFPDGAGFAPLQARLQRVAARYGLPEADQEDCASETLLALLLQHPDWAPDDPGIWPWLLSVAHNKALDVKRRERRHGAAPLDGQVHRLAAASPHSPGDREADSNHPPCPVLAGVTEVLEELSDVNRRIFLLHAREDLDYATIGEGLALTPEQLRIRFNRVLEKVRGAVEPLCGHVCEDCRWGRVLRGGG